MKSFFDKEEYSENDIKLLIKNNAEESIHLDFKAAAALDYSKKKDISKDVSAFANSDGGIIIYGIQELNHKASKVDFIDGNIFTKEWIEQIINSSIHRRIDSIQIFPVRFENKIENTIYVVKIPRSNLAPHMAIDKKYYRRYNFESISMEEYEVRNLYFSVQKAELDILPPKIIISEGQREDSPTHREAGKIKNYRCEVLVYIKNISNVMEAQYKLLLTIPWRIITHPGNHNSQEFAKKINRVENENAVCIIDCFSPLFQNEVIKLTQFNFIIGMDNLEEIYKSQILLNLLYGGGTKELTINLAESISDKIDTKKLIFH